MTDNNIFLTRRKRWHKKCTGYCGVNLYTKKGNLKQLCSTQCVPSAYFPDMFFVCLWRVSWIDRSTNVLPKHENSDILLAWIFEGNKQFEVWGWGEEQGETNIGSSCWGVAQLETGFVQTTFLLKTEPGPKLFCYFLFLWSQIKRGDLSCSDDVKWSHEIYLLWMLVATTM